MAVKVTRRVIRSCTSAMDWGVLCVSGRREWTKKPNAALAHMATKTITELMGSCIGLARRSNCADWRGRNLSRPGRGDRALSYVRRQ